MAKVNQQFHEYVVDAKFMPINLCEGCNSLPEQAEGSTEP
jgi:hypothetical protein